MGQGVVTREQIAVDDVTKNIRDSYGKLIIEIDAANTVLNKNVELFEKVAKAADNDKKSIDQLTIARSAAEKAVDQANATGKFDYLLGYEVLAFNGDNSLETVTVRNVKTQEEQDITVEGAFVFIGQVPETGFIKDLGITNKYGYIVVDKNMATSIPGIYGIGDVIDKDLRQIVTAAADGTIAAVQISKYIESLGN